MIFKQIAGLRFYPKSLMLYIIDLSQRALQTKGFFFKIPIRFRNFGRKLKFFQNNSEA